jgi:DNA repair exonuclease SbcCD nuclease subunit
MTLTPDSIALHLQPLRFIHASDLHLERTIEGVTECPAHWEQRMLDISKRAAERLFQECIEEEIDFLVLSGNVLNANVASPGIFLFLLEQFERLKKAGIPVYWAGGEFDSPEDMPSAFPLPDNVRRFPSDSIQEFYFQRTEGPDTLPIAKLVGMSRNQRNKRIRSSEFPVDPGGLFTIAVANGEVEPETLSQRYIDYWAMGGSNRRHTFHGNPRKKGPDGKPIAVEAESRQNSQDKNNKEKKELPPQPFIVHYPGATLARTPLDIGHYGATLVEVALDESRRSIDEPVLSHFSTSPIRWVNDRIVLEATDESEKLTDELLQRAKNYKEAQKADDLFINWLIDVPPGNLAQDLRRSKFTDELLSKLRTLYGQDAPMTWSVSISVIVPEQLPKAHYEQQTILGDFLRSVKHFQDNPQELIHLGGYIPKNWEHEEAIKNLLLAEKVTDEVADAGNKEPKERWVQSPIQTETQQRVLREAAMVGLELFSQTGKDML